MFLLFDNQSCFVSFCGQRTTPLTTRSFCALLDHLDMKRVSYANLFGFSDSIYFDLVIIILFGMHFLTSKYFVALRFFVGYGLELSRVVPLIIFHLKKKYLCKTEAELKQAWFPGDLGYATRIPGDMLVITIALCYSVIAPLIIPFGVVYFGLGWLVLRNQVRIYLHAIHLRDGDF